MELFPFTASDGTTLEAWRNEGSGPKVLLCNGFGSPPEAWPGLLDPECDFDVVSWSQRGFQGSPEPDDIATVRIPSQAGDARDLMDVVGWDSAVVMGWSFGVNMAVEFALDNPARTTALLAISGLPGGTFRGLLGNSHIPPGVRERFGKGGVHVAKHAGREVGALVHNFPSRGVVFDVLKAAGIFGPKADKAQAKEILGCFMAHDFSWFLNSAGIVAEHKPMDLSKLTLPTTVLTGALDLVTDSGQVVEWAESVPGATLKVIKDASHFIPFEYPEVVEESLRELFAQTETEPVSIPRQAGYSQVVELG